MNIKLAKLYHLKLLNFINVKVIFIDADANKELLRKYKVKGVPAIIVFKDSIEEFRHVGLIDKKELLNNIKLG